MNNEISKVIMTKARLRNRFLKNSSNRNRDLFCKQRNLGVSLLKKSKILLPQSEITDNKRNWKTAKPFLPSKVQS